MKLIQEFLKYKSIDDVDTPVHETLLEFATDNATYLYGNGELIIYPVDESLAAITYVIDIYGDRKYLVEC